MKRLSMVLALVFAGCAGNSEPQRPAPAEIRVQIREGCQFMGVSEDEDRPIWWCPSVTHEPLAIT